MSSMNASQMAPFQEQGDVHGNHTGRIIAIVGALIAIAVVVLAIFLVKGTGTNNSSPSDKPHFDITDYTDGGIPLGTELVAGTKNEDVPQVDIYFDYACTHCNHLDNEYGTALGEAAKSGSITLVYHPVAIMSTLFSYTGAGAEFFVASTEPDKYFTFHELLHEKIMTPYMNGKISNPRAQDIVDIAREAGISEENCEALLYELTAMEDILENNQSHTTPLLTHVANVSNTFVEESIKATGGAGTPTVYIDGQKTSSWPEAIANLLGQ